MTVRSGFPRLPFLIGSYSPKVNGKRMARNVYAHTEEECEEKLAEPIKEMKIEIEKLKQGG